VSTEELKPVENAFDAFKTRVAAQPLSKIL
jgi:hypothetical protein